MDEHNENLPEPDEYRSPWRSVMFIFIALVVASAGVYAIYQVTKSDGDGTAATETTEANTVSASDEDVTELPQNPSLRLFSEEGITYVENNGNVTMSSVQVRDGAAAAVCDLGTISPGDRQGCDAAAGALAPLTASGSGPQGQAVEVGLE